MTRLRLIIYALVLLLIIGMGIYIHLLHTKIDNVNSYKSLYEVEHSQNLIFKAKDSTWHNRTEVAVVSKSELKYVQELQNLHKEFEGVKKNLKNLESYTQLSQVTTINKTIHIKDSVFTYTTKFDTIRGRISNDSVSLISKHYDKLKVVQYWERKWFLGKKTWDVEIKSDNPNTIITYQKSIMSKKKKNLLGL